VTLVGGKLISGFIGVKEKLWIPPLLPLWLIRLLWVFLVLGLDVFWNFILPDFKE